MRIKSSELFKTDGRFGIAGDCSGPLVAVGAMLAGWVRLVRPVAGLTAGVAVAVGLAERLGLVGTFWGGCEVSMAGVGLSSLLLFLLLSDQIAV